MREGQLYNFKGPWASKKIRARATNFYIKITIYRMDNKNYFTIYV